MNSSALLNSASTFYIVLCIVLGILKPGLAEDGHLSCKNKWIDGVDVTLRCEVSKASLTSKCVTQQNRTVFRRDNLPQCEVGDEGYADCPMGTDSQSGACWCEQNQTYYVFKYRFTVNRYEDSGLWTCRKGCFDSSAINNPLKISADATCNASVEENDCDRITCNKPAACELVKGENKGKCVCPSGYYGEECNQCGPFTHEDGCSIKPTVLLVCLSTLMIIIIVASFLLFGCLKQRVFMPGRNVTLKAEDVNALRNKLQNEVCCPCSSPDVSFLYEPTENRTAIILESRNWFNLWKAERQTEAFIEKTRTSDSNNEPPADYPTRSSLRTKC